MTPAMTPEDVYRRTREFLLAGDFTGWMDLWAEDAVMEFPFAPPGRPRRLDGRAAVAAYMAGFAELIRLDTIEERAVHRTGDPEVIVVEMSARGQLVPTGSPYEMSYVAVLTVRDGLIAHYRDYWDSFAVARFLGGDPAGELAR